jgi:hypothetical protein
MHLRSMMPVVPCDGNMGDHVMVVHHTPDSVAWELKFLIKKL